MNYSLFFKQYYSQTTELAYDTSLFWALSIFFFDKKDRILNVRSISDTGLIIAWDKRKSGC